MDAVASPPGGDLKLIRADAAEVAVATGSIVKAFDVVRDVFVRKFAVLVMYFLIRFSSSFEERLGNRIVPAVSLRLMLGSSRFDLQKRFQASLPYCVP